MSDAPTSPCGSDGGSHESGEHSPHSNFYKQDRFLPIANISRIMKKVLPPNGKIAKDAKETMQECVSDFISFVTKRAISVKERRGRPSTTTVTRLYGYDTFNMYIKQPSIFVLSDLFQNLRGEDRQALLHGDSKGSAKGGDAS
ncbi:hypothetical protein JHK84_031765 [Glycine max]|nr:hypothetical protein JHK84_031765 [Glycine max]